MNTQQENRDIHEEKINIVWIEENIIRDEKTKEYNELYKTISQDCYEYKKFWFEAVPTVAESIAYIKKLKFEATIIIVSLNLYEDFCIEFMNNMNNIYIIPKIKIFKKTGNTKIQNKNIEKLIKNPFYNSGILTSFEGLKDVIKEEIKNKKEPIGKYPNLNKQYFDEELIFDYIDKKEKLLLPMFYKVLIEREPSYTNESFNERVYNFYINDKKKKNIENNKDKNKNDILINSLKSIISIKKIPIQLLSKYYARIYTYQSDFYYNLNRDLRNNKEKELSDYLPFIKTLYEGVDLKSLPLVSQNDNLYRGSQVSITEINEIKKHDDKRSDNLPTDIVFSNVFLSFSKEKNTALGFLNQSTPGQNLCKVLFIVEKRQKDSEIKYSLDTHTDLKDISFFENESEVLFFPFSSFAIKNIEDPKGGENFYTVTLDYLGKYLKEFKEEEITKIEEKLSESKAKKEKEEDKLPNSKFKNYFKESKLVKKEKVENINKKQIFEEMDKYEDKIKRSQIKVKKENEPINIFNKEFYEEVSLSNLTDGLTKKKGVEDMKIKCTKCKLFTFILFLSLLIRLFIYFIVYIVIRNENENNDIDFSFLSRISNITVKKRVLSKYSDNYYNCIKGQCAIINSNIIYIGLREVNNSYNNNDLYLSLDGLDKNNNLIDKFHFGKLERLNSSVNLRGENSKYYGSFKINLDKIPYNISSLAILINSNYKNSLKDIIGGYVSIYEEDTQNEINQYSLNDIKDGVIFLYGIIERTNHENKWIFRRIYKSFDERNISYNKILLNETIIIKDI